MQAADVVRPRSDGEVTIRGFDVRDRAAILAGRDAASATYLGPEDPDPSPRAVVVASGLVVGWVDYDLNRSWLQPGEVNVGYCISVGHRRRGFGARAVRLLLGHIGEDTAHDCATFLIHPTNRASLALVAAIGAERVGDLDGNPYFKVQLPPGPLAARTAAT